jgi:hypothetical protein
MNKDKSNVKSIVIPEEYGYNGLKKELFTKHLMSPSTLMAEKSLVGLVGMNEVMDVFSTYKNEKQNLVFVYNPMGRGPKKDFVGAHFLMGRLLDFSPYNMVFDGPEGKTLLGVPFTGSSMDMRPEYIHDIFPITGYVPQSGPEQRFYVFGKRHCEDMPMHPYIKAQDSVEAFLKLCQREPSLRSEMKTGYTLPVKLVGILSENIVDGTLDLPSP